MRALVKATAVMTALGVVLAVGGCGSGDSSTVPSSGNSSSAVPTTPVERDDALASSLPESIRTAGTMTVGINVPYEPNEFIDDTGKLVGFDVDLMNAVATVLGVKPEYRRTAFAALMAGIPKGRYDLAISSLTDNTRREKTMDFVTYFNAGVSWAARAGHPVSPDAACGRRVAVKTGTVADRVDVDARSRSCVANGRKAIVVVRAADQDEVRTILLSGRADAMAADSPIAAYQVKESDGALVLAPGVFLSQPYGIAFAKNSKLVEPVRAAVQSLMDSGQYLRIAQKWGVDNGTIPSAVVNGAYGES